MKGLNTVGKFTKFIDCEHHFIEDDGLYLNKMHLFELKDTLRVKVCSLEPKALQVEYV